MGVQVTVQVFFLFERQLVVGREDDLQWFHGLFDQNFKAKSMRRVWNPKRGCSAHGHSLKKKICWTLDGFSVWHTVKHVEKVFVQVLGRKLGSVDPTPRSVTPPPKHFGKSTRDSASQLEGEHCKTFCSMAPTALYIACDPVEIQQAVGAILEGMESSTAYQWLVLCRMASYVEKHPGLELVHTHQQWPNKIVLEVDSNWAPGRDCKPVDGGLTFLSSHLIHGLSAHQREHAFSSAEAECHPQWLSPRSVAEECPGRNEAADQSSKSTQTARGPEACARDLVAAKRGTS